jgi:hypothetical protein
MSLADRLWCGEAGMNGLAGGGAVLWNGNHAYRARSQSGSSDARRSSLTSRLRAKGRLSASGRFKLRAWRRMNWGTRS